jgi:hypothetical protein
MDVVSRSHQGGLEMWPGGLTMTTRLGLKCLILRGVVPVVLVASAAVAGGMSFVDTASVRTAADSLAVAVLAPATEAAGPGIAELIPAPPLPDTVLPDLPLPSPEPSRDTRASEAGGAPSGQSGEPLGTAYDCIGYGCSAEQDAEINRAERKANAGESAARLPTSGETQYEYGCSQGYIPAQQC